VSELPEGFDSIFRYIAVVSQRAEQLISGAKVRSDTRFTKPTMQAKDDVDTGMVDWRVLTQEELDAQRQAIVEQFRAEVGADEYKAIAAPSVQAMLNGQQPAANEAEAAARDEAAEERDDELARLQRLLGLAGPSPSSPASPTEAEAADGEEEDENEDENDDVEPIEEELSLEDLEVDVDESFDDEDE
jgi:DNA-directed RNA polymerase subunit K/omega